LDPEEVFACIKKMTKLCQCLDDAADEFWEEDEPHNFGALVTVEILNQCGWTGKKFVDRFAQWVFVVYFRVLLKEKVFLIHDQQG